MDLVAFVIICVKVVVVLGAILAVVPGLTYVERRVSAFIQNRLGPNRVGPGGLFQPLADGVKFIMKEDIIPAGVDRPIYLLAPVMLLVPALMTFAVIPFGSPVHLWGREIPLQVADINVGVLYILALTSVGVYGIVLAGWSSNSKYPLLGGLRSAAQMISYELALGLAVVSVVLLSGSLRLNDMVTSQQGGLLSWNIFKQPLAFLIFLVAAYAETNRLPFDLTEAEQELVGGYHTEYSSMKFAMFFLSEYANMVTASALTVTLFFGGWDVPFINESNLGNAGGLISLLAFVVKVGAFLFLFMWVRWSFPRFRYDQLMNIGWKVMLPLALVNILVTGGYLALRA